MKFTKYVIAAMLLLSSESMLMASEANQCLPEKLSLTALEGRGKLDRTAVKGKNILVQFWASWCVGCSKVMEDLMPFTPDGRKAMYLSVSLDETKDQARDYFRHQKDTVKTMRGKSWFDTDTTLATALGIKSLPALVLIDSEGNVVENLYGHPTPAQMTRIQAFLK